MGFQVGDKVIHCTHGMGEIVAIEPKTVHERPASCYVVRIQDLTVWIPIDDLQQHGLRLPAQPAEFVGLFDILSGPCEQLQEDRLLRKDHLMAQLRDGQLASLCRLIRDLTCYRHAAKLNDQENSILERATKSLLTEWTYSLGLPLDQAQQDLTKLLEHEKVDPYVKKNQQPETGLQKSAHARTPVEARSPQDRPG